MQPLLAVFPGILSDACVCAALGDGLRGGGSSFWWFRCSGGRSLSWFRSPGVLGSAFLGLLVPRAGAALGMSKY